MRLAGLLLLLLAACGSLVPATVPPQLAFTPGPPISFEDNVVVLDNWRVPVPPDWTVVKNSTAEEALRVVLVSPDKSLLITAGLSPLDAPETDTEGRMILLEEKLTQEGTTLYLLGQALPEHGDTLEVVWEEILLEIAS